jgi:hypothetical protein
MLRRALDGYRGVSKFLFVTEAICSWREDMKARQLIDSASYGPDALKAMGQAFDAAWHEIAGSFGDDPRDVEVARVKLANAVLSVACEECRDVQKLKKDAMQAMAHRHRARVGAGSQKNPRRSERGTLGVK